MEFCFQPSTYHIPSLIHQVSAVLQMRTERISREACPKLWAITDRLASRKVSDEVLKRRHTRYRIYGVLLIAMGIFLLVPGLAEPNGPALLLFFGFAGIVTGTLALWHSMPRRHLHTRFDKAASALLDCLQAAPSTDVQFTVQGMTLGEQPLVPYNAFDFAIETKDLFVLIWNEKITVLQKKDIATGNAEQFRAFLQTQVDLHIIPSSD